MEVIRYDYDTLATDGSDNLTTKIKNLLNAYPGFELITKKEVKFQELDTTAGLAMFITPNIAITQERISITGHVRQTCAYAFMVVFRTRQSSDTENVKEWLDTLGRWLEQEEVVLKKGLEDTVKYKLATYPKLDEQKQIQKIQRTSQAYLSNTTDDKAEDWVLPLQMTYKNEYDRT